MQIGSQMGLHAQEDRRQRGEDCFRGRQFLGQDDGGHIQLDRSFQLLGIRTVYARLSQHSLQRSGRPGRNYFSISSHKDPCFLQIYLPIPSIDLK